ncbi:MAG TPA: hypothetical protein VH835_03645 [Dongiaceae bacterium]
MSAAKKKITRHFLASGRDEGEQGRENLSLVSPDEAMRLIGYFDSQWCAVLCGDIWMINPGDDESERTLIHGWEVEPKSRTESWQAFIQRANSFANRMIASLSTDSLGAAAGPFAPMASLGVVSEVDYARLRRDRLRQLRQQG